MRFRLNLRAAEREEERRKGRGEKRWLILRHYESSNFLNAGPRDISSGPSTLLTLILYTMTSEIVVRPPPSPSFRLLLYVLNGRKEGKWWKFWKNWAKGKWGEIFNWNIVDFFSETIAFLCQYTIVESNAGRSDCWRGATLFNATGV